MNSPVVDRSVADAVSGDQLVLVPGLACTEVLFAAQIARLAPGASIRIADTRQDDTIAAMARRLIDTIDGPFALAGLSMGGYVALEVIRQAPSRVTRLALLDTTAAPDAESAREGRVRLMDFARHGQFEKIHEVLWPRLVSPAHAQDGDLEASVYAMLLATGGDIFIQQQTAIMGRADSRALLARIAVPTLMVVGEHDAITPVAAAREIAGQIPGARLVVVEGAGHLSTMEAPDVVADAMEGWLKP